MSKTEIAIINSRMFGEIDFTGMSKTISKLAEQSSVLTDKEKEMAISVIGDWERDVIKKLYQKSNDASSLINTLKANDDSYYSYNCKQIEDIFTDEQLEILASRGGFSNTLTEYINAREEVAKSKAPLEPIIRPETTTEEAYQLQAKYSVDIKKYRLIIKAQERRKILSTKELLSKLKGVKEVQDLIKKAKEFRSGVDSMCDKCKNLSQNAKINVVISSEDARSALKEMLNFEKDL